MEDSIECTQRSFKQILVKREGQVQGSCVNWSNSFVVVSLGIEFAITKSYVASKKDRHRRIRPLRKIQKSLFRIFEQLDCEGIYQFCALVHFKSIRIYVG